MVEKAEELWDAYSVLLDSDIDNLSYYSNRLMMTEQNFHKAMQSYASQFKTTSNSREQEGGWIAVGKELPSIGDDEEYPGASDFILLSDGEFTYYGQYEESEFGKCFIDSNGDDFSDDGVIITHWQPLPAPPGGNKKG